jgi:hypothetical protein
VGHRTFSKIFSHKQRLGSWLCSGVQLTLQQYSGHSTSLVFNRLPVWSQKSSLIISIMTTKHLKTGVQRIPEKSSIFNIGLPHTTKHVQHNILIFVVKLEQFLLTSFLSIWNLHSWQWIGHCGLLGCHVVFLVVTTVSEKLTFSMFWILWKCRW